MPEALCHFFIIEFVIDSVRTHHYEIMLVAVDLEISDFWLRYQHLRVALVLRQFCLDISERPRDR